MPDDDIGSGIHIYVYALEEGGGEIWIGTTGEELYYVIHVDDDGNQADLLTDNGVNN